MRAKLLQIAQSGRWSFWRQRRLGPVGLVSALALVLAVGSALLLGSGAVSARPIGQMGAGASGAPVGTQVARADVHVETLWQGKDLELNVALTQTQNDCQAPLNGGVCLRYSVLEDEEAVLVGYGVIPASDVKVTPGVIALHVDTRQVQGFKQVVGPGQLISITWQAQTGKAGSTQRASVRGSLGAFAIPGITSSASNGANTSASASATPGASTIATILMN